MIAHVCPRGKSMPGLMRYLYGPGKDGREVHTDQHMIASSGSLTAEWTGPLSPAEAAMLGRGLEDSWREQHAEQRGLVGAGNRGGVSTASLTADGTSRDAEREHVYHVALSLKAGESFTDEQWASVAGDFVQGMGFTTGPQDTAGSSWVAVRHGLSENGNDHIHVAINLVRQDGHRAQLPSNDYRAANDVRRQIEERRDFVAPLHDRDQDVNQGLSLPAYTQREAADARELAGARGHAVPDRVVLQRHVRAAAEAAETEAGFINAVCADDRIEMEAARWSPGGRDTVTGYRVRLDEGRWFTATQLAPDLTLQKLRPGWQWSETTESRAQAGQMWREETPLQAVQLPQSAPTELAQAVDHLEMWNTNLEQLDPSDRAAWKREVAHAAGVMSTLAGVPEVNGDHLGATADQLARWGLPDRAARAHQGNATDAYRYGPSRAEMAARHVALAARASGPDSRRGWAAVLQQMQRTVRAVYQAQTARGELVAAQAALAGVQPLVDTVSRLEGDADHTRRTARDERAEQIRNLPPVARRALEAAQPGITPEGLQDAPRATSPTETRPAVGPSRDDDRRRGRGR